MEYEDKFLNKDYLETRMRDFKEIRNNEITFQVVPSPKPNSKSIYINLYMGETHFAVLRISDHSLNSTFTQFIVDPSKILSKKKKEQFVALVNCVIKKAKTRHFNSLIKEL